MSETPTKNPHAVALSALGARKGGLTKTRRRAAASRLNGLKGGRRPHLRYTIEVKHEGRWMPAPGEASGWTKRAAKAAIAAGIPTVDGSPATWQAVRLVREESR